MHVWPVCQCISSLQSSGRASAKRSRLPLLKVTWYSTKPCEECVACVQATGPSTQGRALQQAATRAMPGQRGNM